MKIRNDKYDKTFSKFIKLRDQCCQKCGKMDGKLECSHIFSRRHIGLRWDEKNAKLLCFSCHRWWHENPPEAAEWLKDIIGEREYTKLRIKANQVTKLSQWDKDEIRKRLLSDIKEMEDGIHTRCFNARFQL